MPRIEPARAIMIWKDSFTIWDFFMGCVWAWNVWSSIRTRRRIQRTERQFKEINQAFTTAQYHQCRAVSFAIQGANGEAVQAAHSADAALERTKELMEHHGYRKPQPTETDA